MNQGYTKGIASSKTKGISEFINYSFDVKVEGENVPRAFDMMLHNNKNTPPVPVLQPPIIAVMPGFDAKQKCPFCKKDL